MGWYGGTLIFDRVIDELIDSPIDDDSMELVVKSLVCALDGRDWDSHQDSIYWGIDIVQKVMRDLHPEWFKDEE